MPPGRTPIVICGMDLTPNCGNFSQIDRLAVLEHHLDSDMAATCPEASVFIYYKSAGVLEKYLQKRATLIRGTTRWVLSPHTALNW